MASNNAISDNEILDRIYSMKGEPAEVREAYKAWARSYDKDTVEGMGYIAPAVSADKLAEYLARDATILDAGCGTGLAGVELARRGFKTRRHGPVPGHARYLRAEGGLSRIAGRGHDRPALLRERRL